MCYYKLNNYIKALRIFKWLAIIGLCVASSYVALETGFSLGKNSSLRTYDYTKLPNSCFLEALIHSSRASLVLKSETNPQVYSSIFGYTYKYDDDIKINGQKLAMVFGHAICIFEYKNKLWAYDMNFGTMPIGEAGDKTQYNERVKKWAERSYGIKIDKCFVVDDWMTLPPDVTDY
jgi:hypothetical protein